MKEDRKIIIPAAGFGTRVGSPMSKELLSYENERPLILNSVELAKELNCRAHVITRIEKSNLIEYLKQFNHVDIQIISPSKEWPDTILQSSSYWASKNLLILPDTIFSPKNITQQIFETLESFDICPAGFNPESKKTWGVYNKMSSHYELCEKPQNSLNQHFLAWGLLGFKKEIGIKLFKLILESAFDHEFKKTHFSFKSLELKTFRDLTR
jgi:hypothetical protein